MSVLITTLILYQLVLLSIGWWASRRTSDNEDFYLGGRKLGAAVAALSASASSSSAWSLLGVSGAAYAWTARHMVDPFHPAWFFHQLVLGRATHVAAKPGK